MSLPPLDAEGRSRAEQRLHDETIVWLTTVGSDGQPQTSPVGFLWTDTEVLVLSQPHAAKVRNLRDNPKVALHLDTDGEATEDGGVLTLEGAATVDAAPLTDAERSAYVQRYEADMRSAGFTPEEALAEYSTVIRVAPTRVRRY